MPFATQHAFRVKNPDDFIPSSFRRKNIAQGVDIIVGKLEKGGSMVTQAYRFDSDVFSYAEAEAWMKKHKITTIEESPANHTGSPSLPARPQDVHGRGQKKDGKDVFDTEMAGGGEAIHTPQFIKVAKKPVKQTFELDPLWKETKDLMGIEVFEVGTWKGREFTDDDLQMAVQNFRDGILGSQPYITIDHDKDATNQFSKALDGMALGFVSKLYKAGKKLIADFTKVPRVIAELMQAGPLKNKSIELWPEFEAADGSIYKNVLEAVTLTGKIPAVTGLDDFVAFFKRDTGIKPQGNRRKLTLTSGGIARMENTEITIQEYNSLLKFKAEREVQEETVKKLLFKNDEMTKHAETLEKKIVELEKFKADVSKANELREQEAAVSFADALIKKGTILPAHKDLYVDQYKLYKGKGPEMFKLFTDEIEARKPVVLVGELSSAGNTGTGVAVDDNRILEMYKKSGGKAGSKLFEEADKAIKSYMAKTGCSYAEAMKHFKIMDAKMSGEAESREKLEAEEAKRLATEKDDDEDEDDTEDVDAKDGKDEK